MFNRSTVSVSVNLADILVDKKIKLVPIGGTLMAELSDAIYSAGIVRPVNFANLEDVSSSLQFASQGQVQGEGTSKNYLASTHDSFMDNYIDQTASLVSGYLNFARGTVNKEVNKFLTKVQDAMGSFREREAEDFFEIQYYSLPDVFKGYLVSDEIQAYEGNKKSTPEPFNLKCLEEEECLLSRLTVGSDEEDLQITGWYKANQTQIDGYLKNQVNDFTLTVPEQLDLYLVNYLFYRNLANTGELNNGEGLSVVRRKATYNRDYYGVKLYDALKAYKDQIRLGRLMPANNAPSFSYFSQGTIKVVIYEESFAKLAEAGLSIETVLGYLASDVCSNSVTVKELVDAGDRYTGIWNKTRSLYLIHLNSKRMDNFKFILRSAFDASIQKDNLTEHEVQFNLNTKFRETTLEQANAYIDRLELKDLEDLENIALSLIGKIRFRFSNAYDILYRMKELIAQDEKLEPMEAALYAVTDHLTDYMLSQCNIIK